MMDLHVVIPGRRTAVLGMRMYADQGLLRCFYSNLHLSIVTFVFFFHLGAGCPRYTNDNTKRGILGQHLTLRTSILVRTLGHKAYWT